MPLASEIALKVYDLYQILKIVISGRGLGIILKLECMFVVDECIKKIFLKSFLYKQCFYGI